MNKIYRLRFDRRRNELVVVSEITTGTGKEKNTGHVTGLSGPSPFVRLMGTLTPLAFLTGLVISLLPAMTLAAGLPTGGQIVGGQGSISTSGNQMTIHQQTQNMATNWHSFDIGKNNTVQFVQPDSSSVALNRVTGASGSQIMGTLKANGQVFILNPNGVLFGKGARVNVGGLVASTKHLSTADFMKGQYTLSGSGNPGAQVVNQGSLTTSKGGYIVLAGERVSNSGTVTTPSGKTVLAAGKTVTLQLDEGGLTSVSVNGSVVNALVENHGLISADNGQVYLTAKGQDMLLNTVVNNSGTIEAKGLASRGGEIVLDGGDSGVVSQSGQLLADSHTGQGGKITLEGQSIHLAGNSLTSATGKTGGGEMYVGGGWQGKDSRIRNASKVVMDNTATADVSATDAGNGGTAVLWSDDYTNFRGTVLAKGGAQSGNGGRVETSSHNNLQAFGEVNASTPAGRGGHWLLDPADVTIVSTGGGNISETGKGTDHKLDTDTAHIFSPNASGAAILNTSIVNQLNAGTNVTIETSGTDVSGQKGNITVNADIVRTQGGDNAALTLVADGNITITNHNITATAGVLDVNLTAGKTTTNSTITLNQANISTNGGNITLSPADAMNNSNNVMINALNSTLDAGAGEVNITGKADNASITVKGVDLNQTTVKGRDISINGRSGIQGIIFNSATLTATGNLTLNGTSINSGGIAYNDTNSTAANITVTGSSSGYGVSLNSGNLTATNQVNISGTSASMVGVSLSARVQAKDLTVSGNGVSPGSDGAIKGGVLSNTTLNVSGNLGITSTAGGIYLNGSTITAAQNISLTGSNGTLSLNGTNISATNGSVSVLASSGNIRQTGGGISASNDINLTADKGSVYLRGNTVKSKQGSITISGNKRDNTWGVMLQGTNLRADSAKGVINVTATGGPLGDTYVPPGALTLAGNNSFSAFQTLLTGNNINPSGGDAGIGFGNGNIGQVALTINGNASINGTSDGTSGVTFYVPTQINMNNGTLNISGALKGPGRRNPGHGNGGVTFTTTYTPIIACFTLHNSDVNILSDVTQITDKIININAFDSLGAVDVVANGMSNGFKFSGDGNVSVTGKTNTGAGVNARLINNTGLTGTFAVTGSSISGVGVSMDANLNATLVNASITGTSSRGTGVNISSGGSSRVNLTSNTISGTSTSGNGITINGNNVTITNGTLTGTTTGDGSAGVALTGGSNYVISGATVTGSTATGAGIRADGNLSLNNGTTLRGTASSSGSGVRVDGILNSTGGVTLCGTSASGNGVAVAGNSVLSNATVNGTSGSGNGVNIMGNLSTDTATTVQGKADSGTGVKLGGALTGANVTGVSESGAGVQLADKAVVTATTLSGTSTAGAGVAVTGSISLDETSAQKLTATSDSGAGLSLENNAIVSVMDASGQTVTSPVTLSGTSKSGSGIATSGDVSISGVVLCGTASTDTGTGVTLGGSLTLADSLSGVSASSSGNGTALVLNNATVNASAYTTAGKTFTLAATSTGSGAAVKTTGNNTLVSVALSGSSTGEGPAMAVSGSLATDNAVTATVQGNGTALVLDGGTLVSTLADNVPVTVTASATGSSGTAVQVASGGDSVLNNITLNASADTETGTVLDIAGNLTSNVDVTVSTTNGTAVSFNGGRIQGTDDEHPVTLNAGATGDSGTAVRVVKDKTGGISNIALNATATGGDALHAEGTLETQNTTVSATAGTGTALNLSGGTLSASGHTQVTAKTQSGTAVVLSGGTMRGTSAGDLTVSATTGSGAPAVKVSGNSEVTRSQLSGENNGTGSAVEVSDHLTSQGNGNITGQTTSGTAVSVTDGSSITGAVLVGTATTGTGLNVTGNATLSKTTLSGTSATGIGAVVSGHLTADGDTQVTGAATQDGGTGVSLAGHVSGGQVKGTSTSGEAVSITGTVQDSKVSGTASQGAGVVVNSGSQVTNSMVSGRSDTGTGTRWSSGVSNENVVIGGDSASGAGVYLEDNTTLNNATVKGQTDSGRGVSITGSLTNTGTTTVSGQSTGSGEGVQMSGSVSGGKVTGKSVSGSGVQLTDGAKIAGAVVSGHSENGAGIHSQGYVSAENATLNGDSVHGMDMAVNGELAHDPDSVINAQVNVPKVPEQDKTSGQGDTSPVVVDMQRQGAINAQVTQMNRASQDGFPTAGSSPVPVAGYRPAARTVDISLCDGNDCQSESLDAGKPTEGRGKASGR